MNEKEDIKELVSLLKSHSFTGDFESFDKLVDNSPYTSTELFPYLMENTFGIFSFRSLTFDRKYNENEILKRELKWLSLFDLDEQLRLMDMEVDDIKKEHIDILKSGDNIKRKLPYSLIFKLFFEKKFNLLDNLIEKTKTSWSDDTDYVYKSFNIKNAKGTFLISLPNQQKIPLYAYLLFECDKDKIDYLKDKGVDMEDVLKYKNILTNIDSTNLMNMYKDKDFIQEFWQNTYLIQKDIIKEEIDTSVKSKGSSRVIKKM